VAIVNASAQIENVFSLPLGREGIHVGIGEIPGVAGQRVVGAAILPQIEFAVQMQPSIRYMSAYVRSKTSSAGRSALPRSRR
jgi:hypothetical protein